jgi:hypothetical protein
MFVDHLRVKVDIDRNGSNVPIVLDASVSAEVMRDHGPHIRSALPQYERMVDFLGGWSSEHYQKWKVATLAVDLEYGHYSCRYGLPNVATQHNQNLSSAQKELLLWHWRLGISMQ